MYYHEVKHTFWKSLFRPVAEFCGLTGTRHRRCKYKKLYLYAC